MKKFSMTIELGNDAMQTHRHVAKALNELAERIKKAPFSKVGCEPAQNEGKIRDANGNTVGKWSIE